MRVLGRQLFERDRNLGTLDEGLAEEDAVSVDISQYDRTAMDDEDDNARVAKRRDELEVSFMVGEER